MEWRWKLLTGSLSFWSGSDRWTVRTWGGRTLTELRLRTGELKTKVLKVQTGFCVTPGPKRVDPYKVRSGSARSGGVFEQSAPDEFYLFRLDRTALLSLYGSKVSSPVEPTLNRTRTRTWTRFCRMRALKDDVCQFYQQNISWTTRQILMKQSETEGLELI